MLKIGWDTIFGLSLNWYHVGPAGVCIVVNDHRTFSPSPTIAWRKNAVEIIFTGDTAFLAMITVECTDVGLSVLSKAALNQGMNNFVSVVYCNALGTLILLPYFLFHRCLLFSYHHLILFTKPWFNSALFATEHWSSVLSSFAETGVRLSLSPSFGDFSSLPL